MKSVVFALLVAGAAGFAPLAPSRIVRGGTPLLLLACSTPSTATTATSSVGGTAGVGVGQFQHVRPPSPSATAAATTSVAGEAQRRPVVQIDHAVAQQVAPHVRRRGRDVQPVVPGLLLRHLLLLLRLLAAG